MCVRLVCFLLIMGRGIHPLCPSLRLVFPPGHRRQPQVRLAALSGGWQAYDTSPRREDHQFLFPDVIPGRIDRSGLHCREGCSGPAHQVAQQRMEPTQRPGQWYCSWVYRYRHVSTISPTARFADHLGFENYSSLTAEEYANPSPTFLFVLGTRNC